MSWIQALEPYTSQGYSEQSTKLTSNQLKYVTVWWYHYINLERIP